VLYSLRTEHSAQQSQLKQQLHALQLAVEKYRILASIEHLTHEPDWDAEAAVKSVILPPEQKTEVAVGTQSLDVAVVEMQTAVDKQMDVSRLRQLADSTTYLSESSVSFESCVAECSSTSVEMHSAVSTSQSVLMLTASPVDTQPPIAPPPPLNGHLIAVFPPPPPPLLPNFGAPLGLPLRDGLPPPPPPPPPPIGPASGLSLFIPSPAAWTSPGVPVTRRRSTPVPPTEMKPLFWKKIADTELTTAAAAAR